MSRLPENKQRRLEGLNQDVLAVAAPSPVPLLQPVSSPVNETRRSHDGQVKKPSWVQGVSLVVALFAVAIAGLLFLQNQHLAKQLAVLEQQQAENSKELSELMELPVVGKSGSSDNKANSISDAAWRAALLQINKRLRALDIEQNKLQGQLGSGSDLDGQVAALDRKLQQLAHRVETLSSAPASAPAATMAPANNAELDALKAKVNHMDKDLQSLYRILQGH